MTTTLAAQLKKLAVPQTSLLQESNKKASLLFDPREAARFDRDDFYEIGISGFEELVTLNEKFMEFRSLFDIASRSLERSVGDEKTNKILNKQIRKFLFMLSPYFLIKAAQKALEWLVNRFHIEAFNTDDLMSLILPYHNTRIFVRVLQMMDVSDPGNKWHWLYPLQKPGIPLSKTVLLNRCASDPSFLKFVCETTSAAVSLYENDQGSPLSTLLAFHCTAVIGGLEYSDKVNEVQITHLLPSLLEGLKSHLLDYVAASYMIVAQLVRVTKLHHMIIHSILQNVIKCPHSSLQSERAVLLVLLYQTQNCDELPHMPAKTLNRLVKLDWLPSILGQLKDAGVNINAFFKALLQETLLYIQTGTSKIEDVCKFTEHLIQDALDETSASQALYIILENFDIAGLIGSEETDVERGRESGEEKEVNKTTVNDNADEIIKWYSKLFQSFELKYPKSYDMMIQKYLNKDEAVSKHGKTLRVLLGISIRYRKGLSPSGIEMFEKLNHPSASLRAEAVHYLVTSFASLRAYDKDLFSSTLSARLQDNSVEVLREALNFPTKVLVDLLGAETVLEKLIALSDCCLRNASEKWCTVANLLVPHLCSDQLQDISESDKTRIVLTLLPFFFPKERSNVHTLRIILKQKSFIGKCKFLSALSRELENKESDELVLHSCSFLIKCLSERQMFLDLDCLLECSERYESQKTAAIHIFFLLLSLGPSFTTPMNPETSRKILETVVLYGAQHKVVPVPGDLMESNGIVLLNCINISRSGSIPLPAFLYCMLQLTHCTPLPNALKSEERKWWDLYFIGEDKNEEVLKFTVRMLEVLIKGCGSRSLAVRSCYANGLKEFFKAHFLNLISQLRFLCNVCACPGVKEDGICWAALRLRCLHLLRTIAKETDVASLSWTRNLNEPIVPTLIIAASNPLSSIRHCSLSCLLRFARGSHDSKRDNTYSPLLLKIEERRTELELDEEQLPIIMYTNLSPDTAVQSLLPHSERHLLAVVLDGLLNCVTSMETPPYVKVGLLNMLMSVNSQEIVMKLIPLGQDVLLSGKGSDNRLNENRSAILCNIIQRLTHDTASCLSEPQCMDFFLSLLLDWRTKMVLNTGENTCPSILVMQQISRELFEVLDGEQQQKLLTSIVKAASDCEMPEVASAAGKAIKKVVLDCKFIGAQLEKMKNAQVSEGTEAEFKTTRLARRKANPAPSPALLKTEPWQYGVTLLEWVQSKKKLQSVDTLLSPLFSVLSKCLEFTEQAPLEYTKQLLLSCILNCCQKLSPDGTPIQQSVLQAFNVEAIVQCIRASQNPQTHHHALLALAHVAGMMPEQVLHNIMSIFTFMGSSIFRQDDAYSFQVISKVVDTIIPILVKANEVLSDHSSDADGAMCSVMRVFADTAMHVPSHRRLLLYEKLLTTLGPNQSLWMFVCLLLEGHVVHRTEDQPQEISVRQEFVQQLVLSFPSSTVILTCIRLVKYMQPLLGKDQSGKLQKQQKNSSDEALKLVPGLFNIKMHSPKQLRHYKFSICTFLSTLLSSPHFVKQVAELSDESIKELEPLYQELIENLLIQLKIVSHLQSIQNSKAEQAVKYWNAMLNLTFDILDRVNALLPSSMFLIVISGLLNHKLPTVRRKAMELLNIRLQHQAAIFSTCSREEFYNVLEPLVIVMGGIGKDGAEVDIETNQQTAMLSIKLLARQLAPEDPTRFKQILEHVTELMKSKAVQNNLLASVVLCLAELVSVLHVHAIGYLNQFMPAVIKILKKQRNLESSNLVLLSVVTATQKIVDIMPNFLSPYLGKVLLEVSMQSSKWQHASEDSKVIPINHKLKAIRQKISTSIPPRVLLPAIGSCYSLLLEQRQYAALGPLLSVIADNFSSLPSSEFAQLMPEITSFFLEILQFRSDSSDSVPQKDISEAEGHMVNALVALVLRLSESTFKPLYHTLIHWASSAEAPKDHLITLYRLSSSIAEALKGLFVLFAGRLVQNAAKLLDQVNLSKINEESQTKLMYEDDERNELLLQYMLETLQRMFLYDNGQGFINKERFDALLLPIVDQLENTLGGVEALQSRASSLLSPCITQFAVATADDSLWKQLNYQILLKTRHNLPQVRLAALEALCEMVRKLGEDYLPLLPETVPFLAELLEDEEEMVETACQNTVQDLEEILGEPIKKYF